MKHQFKDILNSVDGKLWRESSKEFLYEVENFKIRIEEI